MLCRVRRPPPPLPLQTRSLGREGACSARVGEQHCICWLPAGVGSYRRRWLAPWELHERAVGLRTAPQGKISGKQACSQWKEPSTAPDVAPMASVPGYPSSPGMMSSSPAGPPQPPGPAPPAPPPRKAELGGPMPLPAAARATASGPKEGNGPSTAGKEASGPSLAAPCSPPRRLGRRRGLGTREPPPPALLVAALRQL